VTGTLLLQITGLAALDAVNPATIAGVALILLAPLRRPGASALAFVACAYAVVLLVGAAVYLGADSLSGALTGGVTWVRRTALGLAAAAILVTGLRRLRTQRRRAVELPAWFGPWTAAPLGVLVTGADLPNAFPYLIAIERLVAADVPAGPAALVLAGYALVYCLPCLLLLAVGLRHRDRVRTRLSSLYDRIGRERLVPRSVPVAVGLVLLSMAVAGLAAGV